MRLFSTTRVGFRNRHFMMASFMDDWGEDDVVLAEMSKGTYNETDTMDWWVAMCVTAPSGSLVGDVGSYSGLYSLLAVAVRTDIKAVAFEASATTYGRLCFNIFLNEAELRVIPNHFAVANDEGILQLSHAYGTFTMASGESINAAYAVDHTENVPAVALDRIFCLKDQEKIGNVASKACGLNWAGRIHAIKIDVEGAEELVLNGATALLTRDRPHLIVEILNSGTLERVKTLLSSFGYRLIEMCSGGNFIFAHDSLADSLRSAHSSLERQGKGQFELIRLSTLNIHAMLKK